jgi:hypothetical protein
MILMGVIGRGRGPEIDTLLGTEVATSKASAILAQKVEIS